MTGRDWNQISEQLCERGYVHLPGFIEPAQLADIQKGVSEGFDAAPYGINEITGEIADETRLVGLGSNVDILSIYRLANQSIKAIPADQGVRELFRDLFGNDFYIDRAVVRRARGGCKRFYYHKDQRGDIGLTVLLNDLGADEGATAVLPGRHLGTPPTLFAIPNVNDRHADEVQWTGKAGDAYLFYRDLDHTRAENCSGKDNSQLIFTFVNKNTFPASHSRNGLNPGDLDGLPDEVRHMLRPYDGPPSDRANSLVERLVFGSGFSEPGAGEYDVRNDILRDFLYTMFYVRGKPLRIRPDDALPRNTTRLNETRRVTIMEYAGELRWRLVFRNVVLQVVRKTAAGRASIEFLKKRFVA